MKEFNNKEVIIIAGPSASGKSYIIRQLKTSKKNKLKSQIFRKLSINSRKSKSCISISALKNSRKKPKHIRKLKKEVIFIHFDLTGRHQKQKRQLLLQVSKDCKNLKILTVNTPFNIWRERMQNRFRLNLTSLHKNDATSIYKLSKYFYYLAEWKYNLIYKEWSDFTVSIAPNKKFLVDN